MLTVEALNPLARKRLLVRQGLSCYLARFVGGLRGFLKELQDKAQFLCIHFSSTANSSRGSGPSLFEFPTPKSQPNSTKILQLNRTIIQTDAEEGYGWKGFPGKI